MNRASSIVIVAVFAGLSAVGGVAVSQSSGSPLSGIPNPPAATPLLPPSPAAYSVRLREICAGAVLFADAHSTGTRAGAIAVANDIRTTGTKRLRHADAVPKPPGTRRLAERWIAIERRLTEMYATNYLRIWYAIERAHTPQQRAPLPTILRALIDQPRRLVRQAGALEATLNLPDCTGGSEPPRTGGPPSSAIPPPA